MGARGFPEEVSNSARKVREGFLEVVMAVEASRREMWQENVLQVGG